MTLLQLLATQMAGANRLVLHVGDPTWRPSVQQAIEILHGLTRPDPIATTELNGTIEAIGFEWGHSDGN